MTNAMIITIVAALLIAGEIFAYWYRTRRRLRTVGLFTLACFFAIAFADGLLVRLLAGLLGSDVGGWPSLGELVMWLSGLGLVASVMLGLFVRWTLRTDISDIPGADKGDAPVGNDDRPVGF